ncbi:Heat shock protein GrpE [Alloactinosynnema sp. L-07]|uniref:nucleotide exchange factor GrpE n=1 Tax=Alloactinosynnema sp. L-07 TaxID=1653480 RepID=UPI00065EFFF2|nr:nucleotide exchange factor GrpE [Alloactinosynnema sp. L-07]CRK60530.1 Heat shock protein GrpE [Alloactinosynnema sp. L-07]
MTDQHNSEGEEPRVVVRDRRRIDPDTGQVRTGSVDAEVPAPAGADAPAEPEPAPEVDPAAEFKAQLDERTADLQRLQAEYANYRKRVDRDREVVATAAKAHIVTEMLSVLDDIERAAAHGDLTGAFKAVAEKLAATLQKSGLEPFGHEGEPFDPSVHEAVQHNTSTEVDGPTVTGVLRRGYRFGDRVVRAALVAVTDAETVSAPAVAVVDGVIEAELEEN